MHWVPNARAAATASRTASRVDRGDVPVDPPAAARAKVTRSIEAPERECPISDDRHADIERVVLEELL